MGLLGLNIDLDCGLWDIRNILLEIFLSKEFINHSQTDWISFLWISIHAPLFFFLQVQSELQSKLSFNEQANAVSNMLLKGFNNNNLSSSNLNICKNLGSFHGASNSGIHNSTSVNGNAFSNFASLGLNADHLQVTRPRMRICFDPETEIPRLQKWFSENNHPTRQQVQK